MKTYLYNATINGTDYQLLSLTETQTAFDKGLESKQVIGHLKDSTQSLSPDNIIYNPVFITLFQSVIKATALASADVAESASDQVNGFIYIIDQRADGKIKIKPFNIIAAIEVKDAVILPESFQFNPNYEIVSTEGVFILPEAYEKNLMAAIL